MNPGGKRLFTPQEANRTLPLVRRIVDDILDKGRMLRAIAAEGRSQDESKHRRVEELRRQIIENLRELDAIGCSFKDPGFDRGLVDFPAIIDGEEVLLCWRTDEPRVEWYHGTMAGYAGRKRIPPALLEDA